MPDVGTGRCDFPGGSAEQSYDSLQKIFNLPDDYRIYVGHDYPPNDLRLHQCMATVKEQKNSNFRLKNGVAKEEYVKTRNKSDEGSDVPKLLLPSIQVNLRAGRFGKETNGIQYIKVPINKI